MQSNKTVKPIVGHHTKMEKEKYSNDSPVHTESQDKFSRWSFAERIADVIFKCNEPSSITIGLYGPWGDGKTSVLNFIEESIKINNCKSNSVIVVRFNPWLFGSVEGLLLGFFDVLAGALDAQLITKGEKLKEILKKSAPGIASVAGMKGLGDAVGAFLHGPDIMQLRNRIEEKLEKSHKRILVMVDDVDRLEKAEIQAIFKLVKLVADFKYTAYLLAFDKQIVASSLSDNCFGTNEKSGEQFLEKIIQVPLHLPAIPDNDLRNFCFQGINEALNVSDIALSEQQIQEFLRNFTHALEGNLTTPRRANLYGNILMFSLPILKGEVNPVDLMLLEGIRIFIPELYEAIRKNKDSFVGAFKESIHYDTESEKIRIKEMIDSALAQAGIKKSSGYIELLKNMFPKLEAVYGNMYYDNDWYKEWNKSQRICAEGYFDRYFTYSVPKGDFADTAINFLINKIDETENISLEENPLSSVLTSDNASVLVGKLQSKANSLNDAQSAKLSLAVSLLGDKYPNPESMFDWAEPHTQAAMLVGDFVQNIDKTQKVPHVIECIARSPSAAFQLEIYKWLRRKEEGKPEKDAFTENEISEIGNELAKHIEAYVLRTEDITTEANRIASHIFYILNQYSRKHIITEHIEKLLSKDSSAITRLLDIYTPTAWNMETGVSHKSDFERNQYNEVIRIFDPDFILNSIETYLGRLPEDQEIFPQDFERNDKSFLAHQFVWIHRRVLLEKDNKSEVTPTRLDSQELTVNQDERK